MTDLLALARAHLAEARGRDAGRSSALVVHDGALRQVLVALTADHRLSEHATPAAATLQVLLGAVRVEFDDGDHATVPAGQLHQLAHGRHGVVALEDSAFLLTTVVGGAEESSAPSGAARSPRR